MTVTLTFFSASWKELSGAVGSRHRGLFRKVLEKAEPLFEEVYGPDSFGKGPDFEEGLDRWIQGEVAPADGAPVTVVNLGDALGFVGLIHYFGQPLGTLDHTSSSGRQFRSFLEGKATDLLRPPFPLLRLLDRPIAGVSAGPHLAWGGLTAAELASLAPTLAGDAPTIPQDPDADVWIQGLWNALGSASGLGKDLITIYA
jgi:hypothetical protein